LPMLFLPQETCRLCQQLPPLESCTLFNAEVKKRFKEMLGKREVWDRAKKHGVHVLNAWASVMDHLVFHVVETSSQEAVRTTLRT